VRVLLDHNPPHKLRTSLSALSTHEIVTASYMGWGELKNGELLQVAEENRFEVFVTADQTLAYEQNLTGRRLAIVALSANNWPIIKNRISQILDAINNTPPGSFNTLDCGAFSR
jgi:predicted nuclease of predicted toxin-antitoxin system